MTDTTTTGLVSWLIDQIAEDEADARGSLPGPWAVTEWPSAQADGRWVITSRCDPKFVAEFLDYGDDRRTAHHVTRWDPARVLAECDAKRRIIAMYRNAAAAAAKGSTSSRNRVADETAVDVLGGVLQEYGVAYAKAGRPGYREEWRPA